MALTPHSESVQSLMEDYTLSCWLLSRAARAAAASLSRGPVAGPGPVLPGSSKGAAGVSWSRPQPFEFLRLCSCFDIAASVRHPLLLSASSVTWQWKWRDVPCAAITAARPHGESLYTASFKIYCLMFTRSIGCAGGRRGTCPMRRS